VKIDLPDRIGAEVELTPERVKLETATGLYASGAVTLGQGAELAGISPTQFLHELGKRHICVNYGIEDLQHDLRMIAVLHPELKNR
jgi:predicted HTH domain antitoxin